MIIAPMRFKTNVKEQVFDEQNHPVKGEDGKPLTEDVVREYQTFRPAYVFDYSDTDGEPLPTLATMLDENVDLIIQTQMENRSQHWQRCLMRR